jgi:hypothetical protein
LPFECYLGPPAVFGGARVNCLPFECHLGPLPVFGGARVRGRTVYHSSAIWDHPRVLVGYMLEAEMFAIRVPSGTTPGIWLGTC